VSAPRFFVPEMVADLVPGESRALPESAARHAARVLRMRAGDALTLFTGAGGEFAATIVSIDRHDVVARVDGFAGVERESPLVANLVQAVCASDAMEYAVRKSVELGVAAIQPVLATRSAPLPAGDRAESRRLRWSQIAVAACEQCGRNRVPDVRSPVTLAAWLAAREASAPGFVLAPMARASLSTLTRPDGALDIVIGPEGGFTGDEIAAAGRAGLTALCLGPRVLRTETAGPALLAALHALWGDFR